MPESVLGLPLHPLVVHGAVVLVPLAGVMAVIIAIDPARRARWGRLVWLLAAGATVASFVARSSGTNLSHAEFRKAIPKAVAAHETLGQTAPWLALALLGGVTAMLLLDMDRNRRSSIGSALLPSILSVVVVLVAMTASVQMLWTTWSGAEARWGDQVVQKSGRG